MKPFKPMLASAVEGFFGLGKLKYPVMVSPKLDGIRCVLREGKALSRSLKPIPNTYIRNILESLEIDSLDGEIMIAGKNFNEIQSAVMSEAGEPDFEYHVFDTFGGWVANGDKAFSYRYGFLKGWESLFKGRIKLVEHQDIEFPEMLIVYHSECISKGYEGVMIRDPKGPYKFGRSTLKEGYLLKFKQFKDSEAVVVGQVERMHNANEAFTDELGHTKRSSHKANKVPTGMLGAFKVVDPYTHVEFEVGTGFTEEERKRYFGVNYICCHIRYKYQELSADGVPRFPVFLGFRDPIDMS